MEALFRDGERKGGDCWAGARMAYRRFTANLLETEELILRANLHREYQGLLEQLNNMSRLMLAEVAQRSSEETVGEHRSRMCERLSQDHLESPDGTSIYQHDSIFCLSLRALMHQEVGSEVFWELFEETKILRDILRTTGIYHCRIPEIGYGTLFLYSKHFRIKEMQEFCGYSMVVIVLSSDNYVTHFKRAPLHKKLTSDWQDTLTDSPGTWHNYMRNIACPTVR
jgi:hypothetical protein